MHGGVAMKTVEDGDGMAYDAVGVEVATVAFELDTLPMGTTTALDCVLTADGPLGPWTAAAGVARVARHPPKANAVKVNTRLRTVLVDDAPYLPFGFYLEYDRWQTGAANFSRAMYAEVVNGFNTPLPYRSGSPDRVRDSNYVSFLDEAAAMGMHVHFNMYGVGMEEPSQSKTDKINAYLDLVMDHPALLAYYIADEPDGNGIGLDPLWIADTVAIIRARDPYHPISLVLNCVEHPYRTVDDYAVYADIVLSDPYPIGLRNQVGCDLCAGTVTDVRDRAVFMMQELPPGQPLWMVPQAFGGEQHWDRQPSAREVRAMTYTSIINGARGIQYFILGALLTDYNEGVHFQPHDALWSECRRLALEFADLAPAVLSTDPGIPIRVLDPSSNVEAAAYHEAARGVVTVVVVNIGANPAALTLELGDPALAGRVATVLFEQRTVAVDATGRLVDVIDGFGSRAYRLSTSASSASTAALATVRRAATANLIFNPSFEVQSSVGRPDSYLYTYGNGGSVLADPSRATDGYYSVRVTNPARATNATVFVAGVSSFLGSRLVANTTYAAAVDAMAAVAGLHVDVVTCFGNRTFALTTSWTRLEVTGPVANDTLCQISVLLVDQGQVWLDNVSLTSVPPAV